LSLQNIALMAHLMRRAGFGATHQEILENVSQGYDHTVDHLLDPDVPDGIQQDMLRRYHPDHSGGLGTSGAPFNWLHRMVQTQAPLREKVSLF